MTLRSTTDALAVTVVSRPPSPARGVSGAESGGRGLVGMGERVRAHGGVLRAGPRSDGSFEVAARIPLTLDTPTGDGPWWRRSGPGARWRAPGPWRGYAAPVLALAALELDVAFSNQRRGPVLENVLIAAAMAVALRWRVRRPLAVCLVITALAVPLSGGLTDITQATVVSTFVFVVPVYSVAAWAAARPASVGLVAVLAMILGVGLWHGVTSSELVGNLVMTIALWVVGRLIQAQRRLASSYEAACAALLAERAARQRQQAHHERIRVVSDLETSVRHDVTAMVALAESALDDPSARSGEAIASIETTARTALAAMREIVGVLRPAGELLGEAAPDPVAV